MGLTVYYISFHFIFTRENADFGLMVLKPHNAALVVSFTLSFLVGFFLNKYVVFTSSIMRGRVQLFRYFLVYMVNLCLNYLLLKLLVEVLHVYPIMAQSITIAIIICFSYLFQRKFTFRVKQAS